MVKLPMTCPPLHISCRAEEYYREYDRAKTQFNLVPSACRCRRAAAAALPACARRTSIRRCSWAHTRASSCACVVTDSAISAHHDTSATQTRHDAHVWREKTKIPCLDLQMLCSRPSTTVTPTCSPFSPLQHVARLVSHTALCVCHQVHPADRCELGRHSLLLQLRH